MFTVNLALSIIVIVLTSMLFEQYPENDFYEFAFYISLTFGIINIFF